MGRPSPASGRCFRKLETHQITGLEVNTQRHVRKLYRPGWPQRGASHMGARVPLNHPRQFRGSRFYN